MRPKKFLEILNEFARNPKLAKEGLIDKRLTKIEKDIVQGYLYLRANKNQEARELLEGKTSPSKIVEGHRLLMLGLSLNNLSYFNDAFDVLQKSSKLLENEEEKYFYFICVLNQFFISYNLSHEKKMKNSLNKLEQISDLKESDELSVLRCELKFFLFRDQLNEASKVIKILQAKKQKLKEQEVIDLHVDEFKYFIKLEKFDHALNVLDELKNFRNFNLKEMMIFMRKLLHHLKDNDPIYLLNGELKGHAYLFHQISVIHFLEEADFENAKNHWSELSRLYPHIYLDEFIYHGEKNLFSLCLNKGLSRSKNRIDKKTNEGQDIIEVLRDIFNKEDLIISKDDLFKLCWGREVESKDDYTKLSRSIYRLKKKYGIELKTRKGSYHYEASQVQPKKAS